MTTFRMGGAPGALCPVCSYPHFPFCVRHPANGSALPPMPGSFPPPLPSRAPCRPPIHSPQLPSHLPLLGPSSMTSYQPSPPLLQSFPGRGAIGDAIPNGVGVPLVGRGSNASKGLPVHAGQHTGRSMDGAMNSESIQFGGCPFPNQSLEPFQNPLPPHMSNSRLSTPPNHLPNSVEHFPGPLNPPPHSGSPHNGLLANPRPPPGSAWSEQKERENLLREKGPSMPQWFLDQQRRSSSKGVPPNGRSGIGELLRGEEIVQGPVFGSDDPGARGMCQGRLERDRQGVFENEDVLEAQRAGYRFREDMSSQFSDRDGPGLFPRMDVSGNGVLTESGVELAPPGLWDRFEGGRDGVADRERRLWALDKSRDSSVEQGFSSHNSSHAGYLEQRRGSATPSFGRDAVAGGLQYQTGRKERAEEGMWSQQSSREEQLLHEHGLVDDGVQGLATSGIVSLGEGAEEHWEVNGQAPGRGHFLREGPDGTAHRRSHTEGDQMSAANGTEISTVYHSRQQTRPANADKLHGSGNLVLPERSPVNGERPYFESSGSGEGLRGTATNVDTSHFGGQSDHNSNTPPVQEELDELYYLKHFPQPNDNQVSSSHTLVAPLVHSNQARIKNDGLFQEKAQLVASQKWANERRPAGVQLMGHVQQSDRGHLQQPVQPHQGDRSPPQAHGRQPSHLTSRNSFQQDAQLPGQSYPQHQASILHVHSRQSEVSKQLAAAQPSQTQQISNGQQTVQSSQPAQMQYQDRHHQHERLHDAPHFMQTQVSDLAHQHMQPSPQSQGPLPHQMQQQGQGGLPHPSRFYHPTQGMYQSFGSEEVSVNGRTIESLPATSQTSVPPSIAHKLPAPLVEAPPLPINAADAPPPPPPSPPYCEPPLHSPPMAPPPPPPPPSLAPPLPPSPPPLPSSGLTHVPAVSFSATFPGHPHPLNVEEPLHRLNYLHPTHALPQSLPVVPQGPGFQSMGPRYMAQFGEFRNQGQLFPQQLPQQQDKAKVVDAVSIFRRPGRLIRPDRIVVILRGLPGSGKSYLAKALRDVELMNGGTAPRIHSIDDYFMTEVEEVEGEEAGLITGSSVRSKKRVIKKVMEYCYEPEMEEVYRGSMLKAFRKTLEEGMFSFIIVDDRNVLVADFAQFWAIAKRSGYEVYLLEPPYKDPAGCAARNVHNFKQEQIQDMAKRWEPAPPMYLQLDVSSLFRGDDLNAQDITEVEMDTDDMEREGDEQEEEYQPIEHGSSTSERPEENGLSYDKPATPGDRWEDSDAEAEEPVKPAKRIRFSEVPKNNCDSSGSSSAHGPGNDALSGLMQAYGKREKSVRWADHQDVKDGGKGFSIGSALEKISDLVIGPGPGYNKVSNPVLTEDCRRHDENEHLDQSRKFLEQYRAEQDAFKAVFAIRRQGGPGVDDEDGAV